MHAFANGSRKPQNTRRAARAILAGVFVVALAEVLTPNSTYGQVTGPIGSLGGYGAMAGSSGGTMGAGALAPFGGRIGVVMPSGMGRGGAIAFSERSSPIMSANRPSFTIGPMSGGMGTMAGGAAAGFTRRPFVLRPLELSNVAGLGEAMQPMAGPRGMGVMPPNFGYPFRQPPSVLSGSTSGPGMSM